MSHQPPASHSSTDSSYYWYGHGAAHGNYSVSTTHFLVDSKRGRWCVSDVFLGNGWKDVFGKLVVEKAKADLGDEWQGDDSNEDAGQASIEIDPSRWDFSDEGIAVQFQPYEVASYALGVGPTVTIPWTELDRTSLPTTRRT